MKADVRFWQMQRLTAFLLIPLFLFLLISLTLSIEGVLPLDLEILKDRFFVLSAILLFALVSLYHSMLGLRVIVEDYISSVFLCKLCLLLVNLFVGFSVFAVIGIIYKLL
ncbi:succinate dehydrogenase, hydrophobic membrane anchor protein [Neorickettsia helminthoeca str. Oregon]|uniref:Succinate dehydrogenase hydrophobic membrane anchor subunit n=1 Tax=Neorickettsia helminthoeca str. Oregon TaxID=1286528 RepID=X5HJ03_9RICK|nr:succinate dehydrogenase, hydrophobic membrane anchor protein [Neorickettsia helminthoeca]AHX11024.1 succinate dehydrogenase, hydrophobic membrane anchor protein [Neorickettsia helminthoeca str. Oregon]